MVALKHWFKVAEIASSLVLKLYFKLKFRYQKEILTELFITMRKSVVSFNNAYKEIEIGKRGCSLDIINCLYQINLMVCCQL